MGERIEESAGQYAHAKSKEFTEKEGTNKYRRQRRERRKRERIQKPKKVRNNMPTQNLRYKEKDGKKEEIRNLRRKIGDRNLNMQKARGKRPKGEKERENPRKCGTICPRRVLDRVHGIEK